MRNRDSTRASCFNAVHAVAVFAMLFMPAPPCPAQETGVERKDESGQHPAQQQDQPGKQTEERQPGDQPGDLEASEGQSDEQQPPQGLLPIPDYSGDFWSRSYLSGDWGGARTDLANIGIQMDVQFSQTFQSVVTGGRDTGARYGGTLDFNLNFDLQRMGLLPGGLVTLRTESRYGEWINDLAGPALAANVDGLLPLTDELDENVCVTVTDLYYTQYLSEQFALMIGKFDGMQGDLNEFASGRGVSQFMNYNLVTNAPGGYPAGYSVLGGGVILMPSERFSVMSYVFTTDDSSTTTGFDNLDAWTWNTEAYFQYRLGELPGGLMAGASYSFNNDFSELNGRYARPRALRTAPSSTSDTWSAYMNGWQYLYVEDSGAGVIDVADGKADHQGIGLFGRVAFADDDVNPSKFSVSGGLGGRGIFPGRDDDTFGIGYYYTRLSDFGLARPLGVDDDNQGVEAFYSLAITPAVSLSFDLQALASPFADVDTAVALGMRLNVKF